MSLNSWTNDYPIKKLIKIKPERIYKSPVKKKLSINIPNMKIASNPKSKLYDRFIPYGISPSFNCDPPSYSPISHGKFHEKKYMPNPTKKNNYEKCLLADLVGTSIQGQIITNDPRQNLGYINMMNSKRKVSYSKEKSPDKKNSILKDSNKSFYIDSDRYNLLSQRYKREKKKIKSYKNIFFGENNNSNNLILPSSNIKNVYQYKYKIPDNFYYNVLDMYNLSSILISTTKGGTLLIDYSSNDCKLNRINFGKKRENNYMDSSEYDFDEESVNPFPRVICNKFINSDDKNLKFVSSTTNGDLLLYDVNSGFTDIILKNYDSPVYTFDILNEVVFMGEESGRIEVLDIRESHMNNKNIYYLYSHPGKNEVCKTVYSKNNNYVLSGGNDNNAIIFDFRNYKILKSISHKGAIKGLSINTNENYLVTGGGNKDKMIKLWDLKKVKQISETKANSQITALEFINNSTIFTSFGYNENMSAVYNLDYDELDKENCSDMQLCNISLSNSVQSEINDMKDIFNKQDEFERHYKRILYTSVDKNNQYVANASEGELKIFKIEKYSKSKFDLGLDDCFIFH